MISNLSFSFDIDSDSQVLLIVFIHFHEALEIDCKSSCAYKTIGTCYVAFPLRITIHTLIQKKIHYSCF